MFLLAEQIIKVNINMLNHNKSLIRAVMIDMIILFAGIVYFSNCSPTVPAIDNYMNWLKDNT